MPGGALQHVKVAVSSRRNMSRVRFPFQNEYDVGQYLDHTPLSHPARGGGRGVAPESGHGGRHPWCVIGV
jgi:hypothetical protein